MKKIIYSIILSILALYILCSPENAIQAASFGLLLWYSKMLPTLLPFAILSYIFVAAGLLDRPCRFLHRFLKNILPVSSEGIYPLFAGFLFGFPLGSRITAQLVEEGRMEAAWGNRLFPVCNNISPVFISGFILSSSLQKPELTGVTLLILYGPPLSFFILQGKLFPLKSQEGTNAFSTRSLLQKKAASRSQINFKIIDAGIMSGFETLTKLGGYIMLFAILAQMTTSLPFGNPVIKSLLVGITEITNGVAAISGSALPFASQYPLIIFCTAFGGLSGLAQTASMVRNAGLSMSAYIRTKVLCSLASAALALLYIHYGQ